MDQPAISPSEFSVENVERIFASNIELTSSNIHFSFTRARKTASEPDIGYSANYDDLCGPWKYPENPAHTKHEFLIKPQFCAWGLLTKENMRFVRNFINDEIPIKRFIDNRLNERRDNVGTNRSIFLELVWSVLKFSSEHSFTEESTSAIVGIFHLTYTFFLANPRRTSRETYEFFYTTILLHAVQNPPKSFEIFTAEECEKCLEFFTRIILRHLPLVRFVSVPNYRLVMANTG